MDKIPKRNVGTTLMILQEQTNHNKKLESIYSRSSVFAENRPKQDYLRRDKSNAKKKVISTFEKQQHLKNIKHLLENITRQKTMRERRKDQNDFIAYPALFFRDVTVDVAPIKRKTQRNNKKARNNTKNYSQASDSILSLEKIRQHLPVLTEFDQEELQEWADAVNKMIISYNIMRRDEMLSFAVKVLSLLPQSCPLEFKQAAEKWMDDMCSEKVEVW